LPIPETALSAIASDRRASPGYRAAQLLIEAIELLAADRPLPQRYFDHPLSGEWSDFRDCHINRPAW
jgi:addiction module RelE/StbE family toxin